MVSNGPSYSYGIVESLTTAVQIPYASLLKPLSTIRTIRLVTYPLLFLLAGGSAAVIYENHQQAARQSQYLEAQQHGLNATLSLKKGLEELRALITQATEAGIDTSPTQSQVPSVLELIAQGHYDQAEQTLNNLTTNLNQTLTAKTEADAAAEAQKGSVSGKTNAQAIVELLFKDTPVASALADSAGAYMFHVPADTYVLRVSLTGYTTALHDVTITAGQTTTLDLQLVPIAVSTPTPTPTASTTPKPTGTPKPTATPSATATANPTSSTAHSRFYTQTLNSSRGNFTGYFMEFQLGAGKIKVAVDTAGDDDCSNNCPVLPVKSYVERLGGIAGINGTYFCPKDYSSCSNEVNSFFWKILSGRTGKMINANNGLGERDPFLVFDSVGNPRLFATWDDYMASGMKAYSGINHKPLLVNNGQNVLDENTLDDKQKTAKISRAALVVKGSTLYVVDVLSATIPDLAAAIASLNIDYALNIDAGGSAGMYYNGSYKLGPGRSVPNALVFIEQ
jgi:hypothetical protein